MYSLSSEHELLGDPAKVKEALDDFLRFVASLSMGNYYAIRLKKCIRISKNLYGGSRETNSVGIASDETPDPYTLLLSGEYFRIEELVVELLRYQRWEYKWS